MTKDTTIMFERLYQDLDESSVLWVECILVPHKYTSYVPSTFFNLIAKFIVLRKPAVDEDCLNA